MTLAKVAKKAGVSIMTASKVFNDNPSVRPYLRERVMQAAQELDYRPNLLARGLRQRSTGLVSFGIQLLDNPFFGALAQAVARHLLAEGYPAVLCNNIDRVNEINRTARACGTVLVSPGIEHVRQVVQERALVTLLAKPACLNLASNVGIDFESAYTDLARALLARGRRRVAYFCSHEEWKYNEPYKFRFATRLLRDAGHEPLNPDAPVGDGTPGAMAERIAARCEPVDAVVCGNDLFATRLLHELWIRGVNPCSDVLVVGCDGTVFHRDVWTVAVDVEELARQAVVLLRERLEGETSFREICVAPTLRTTESRAGAGVAVEVKDANV